MDFYRSARSPFHPTVGRIALWLPLVCAAMPAGAVEFSQIQPAQSSVTFVYQQMGVKMTGKFRKFGAQLSFDPARPAAAKGTLDVDLASVDGGYDEANDELAGKSWFNTKAFPQAHFAATAIKPQGGNRYQILGQLTVKGKTQHIVVPATFAAQGKTGVFDGSFVIRRGDFSIGEGAWSKFDVVANEVLIQFHLAVAAK